MLHHFLRKKEEKRDMWQVTHDMWHLTRDTWHVGYCWWFMILWRSGAKGSLNQWMNELINREGVYRTAPATSGLLNIWPVELAQYGMFQYWASSTGVYFFPYCWVEDFSMSALRIHQRMRYWRIPPWLVNVQEPIKYGHTFFDVP